MMINCVCLGCFWHSKPDPFELSLDILISDSLSVTTALVMELKVKTKGDTEIPKEIDHYDNCVCSGCHWHS